jgi:hypothetical protein
VRNADTDGQRRDEGEDREGRDPGAATCRRQITEKAGDVDLPGGHFRCRAIKRDGKN